MERRFLGYSARGAPYGPDDGTIAPWAAATSLPFAPEVVLPTLRRFHALHVGERSRYGFESAFNPTFPGQDDDGGGWTCPWVYGIDQGALALMFENHRTGLVWDRLRRSPHLRAGLRRAGFDGGWLDALADSRQRRQSSCTTIALDLVLVILTTPSGSIAMTDPRTIRVAVNGYGVIGKRVADAVALQNDMTLAGVADVATDWRVAVARAKDYALYGATPEHTLAMTEAKLDPPVPSMTC